MIGVTIMKMMSSTSITSIIGVTLMSALTGTRPLVTDRATGLRRLLRLEFLREDRPAELAADAEHRAEQADERGGRARRREDRQAALELGGEDQHLPLHRALGRVDVARRDRGPVAQQRFHFI